MPRAIAVAVANTMALIYIDVPEGHPKGNGDRGLGCITACVKGLKQYKERRCREG